MARNREVPQPRISDGTRRPGRGQQDGPERPLARAQASVRRLRRAGRIDQPTAFNEALLGFLRAGGLTGLRGPRSALLRHIVGSRDRSHIVWPGVYGRATPATRRLGLSTCRRRRAIALSDSSCRSGQAVHEAAWLSGVGAGRGVVDVALAQDAELVILAVSSGRVAGLAPECAASGH